MGALAGFPGVAAGNISGASSAEGKVAGPRCVPASGCRFIERMGAADDMAPVPKFRSAAERMDADSVGGVDAWITY